MEINIKIVGKIELPKPFDYKAKRHGDIIGCSKHFRTRLKERYNIQVTFKEYIALCKQKINERVKLEDNRVYGIIIIKDIHVKVISSKGCLLTALPFEGILIERKSKFQ